MIENTITTNENLVQVICGVRGYEENGVAYLHIEDAALGLGFTTKVNDTEYVRWTRVDEYLGDFGFLPQVANEENPHDYYIPENIFYRLCMKAKNEVAEKFQAKVADEIIPSIRKTGSYSRFGLFIGSSTTTKRKRGDGLDILSPRWSSQSGSGMTNNLCIIGVIPCRTQC